MSSFRLLDEGFLTTVQDRPRHGLGRFGLSEAGPASPLSFRIANRLAGNMEALPGLEVTMKPPRLLFRDAAVIALSGADFAWKVDGRAVDTRGAVSIRAGSTLHGDYCRNGLRGYIAFAGGLLVERWEGSAATHVEAGMGGMRLRREMDLQFAEATGAPARLRENPPGPLLANGLKTLRFTLGPYDFPAGAQTAICSAPYRVTENSTRVALRLEGGSLVPCPGGSAVSAGAWHGAIQIPPSGIPQILGCEHPATGGYVILGSVIEADWETLGQLRPREEFRFGLVSTRTAVELLKRQESWWESAWI